MAEEGLLAQKTELVGCAEATGAAKGDWVARSPIHDMHDPLRELARWHLRAAELGALCQCDKTLWRLFKNDVKTWKIMLERESHREIKHAELLLARLPCLAYSAMLHSVSLPFRHSSRREATAFGVRFPIDTRCSDNDVVDLCRRVKNNPEAKEFVMWNLTFNNTVDFTAPLAQLSASRDALHLFTLHNCALQAGRFLKVSKLRVLVLTYCDLGNAAEFGEALAENERLLVLSCNYCTGFEDWLSVTNALKTNRTIISVSFRGAGITDATPFVEVLQANDMIKME